MTLVHIFAGALALVAGAVALYAAKGSTLHRRSGTIFVVAMLVMTSSAVLIAMTWSPNRVNVVAGLLTFYLVSTAWLTVKRTVDQVRTVLAGLMLAALATSSFAFTLVFEALGSANGIVDSIPAPPIVMFAVVGLLAATLDARLLWAGGITGAHRLARHLWRMTFAMWIATSSFFLGQAKLFPAPLRKAEIVAIPVLVVTLLLLYWLARVLIKRERAVSSFAQPEHR
jgi:uncharacterized membrane protein